MDFLNLQKIKIKFLKVDKNLTTILSFDEKIKQSWDSIKHFFTEDNIGFYTKAWSTNYKLVLIELKILITF